MGFASPRRPPSAPRAARARPRLRRRRCAPAPSWPRQTPAHQQAGVIDEIVELVAVALHVLDRPRGDAGIHRRLGHRRRDLEDQARIEGLRDQVFGTEGQVFGAIGGGHHLGLLGVRQLGDGAHRGDLHRLVDGGGADVERAAEHEGEAQHVVDLVRVVRTAGADDGVGPHGLGLLGRISGSGLAMARMIGSRAMVLTISGFSTSAVDRPMKTSASGMASPSVRASVFWRSAPWTGRGSRARYGSRPCCRPQTRSSDRGRG
jgi:hypothetical protein